MLERYRACMVLHAVGDAMGFRNNLWESNRSSELIHQELKEMGGVEAITCEPTNWPVSDDTVLHLSTAEWLIHTPHDENVKKSYLSLVKHYKQALKTEDKKKRLFGKTTVNSIENLLNENDENGYRIPFNPKGHGCGAVMRSSCVGLRYPNENQLDKLIEISTESSRLTHHHPIGYLGGFVSALFTSFCLQNKPIYSWGHSMLKILPQVMNYIQNEGQFVKENLETWSRFEEDWRKYLNIRKIDTGNSEPVFPEVFSLKERDEFYRTFAISKRSGGSGHDSVIIAYDSLLGCKENWIELCHRAVLHGGDNDSTGCIAASWYGALYGFKDVPKCNYTSIEYKDRLLYCADELFKLSNLT